MTGFQKSENDIQRAASKSAVTYDMLLYIRWEALRLDE